MRRFPHGLPALTKVGVERRAATLATRSIKKHSKPWAIDTLIGIVDLTTLEGADARSRVRALRAKAWRPDPERPDMPPAARRVRSTRTW